MKPLPLLDALLTPADLRKLSFAELGTLAEEMRHRIKETVSAHGGHLASNLGTIELTIALHRTFDFTSDRILWDVGHQAYPHKLLTGRAKISIPIVSRAACLVFLIRKKARSTSPRLGTVRPRFRPA